MTDIITPWPTASNDFRMPFYYAGMKTLWAFYKVAPQAGQARLDGTGLAIATFDDGTETTALACINVMAYLSEGTTFGGPTGEIEVNLVAYPEADHGTIPRMSVADFLWGTEQTKRVGFMREFVLCDNPNAIMAGRSLFGEYKFLVSFDYHIPSLNVENATGPASNGVQNLTSWTFTGRKHHAGNDADPMPALTPQETIFTLDVDLSGLSPSAAINQTALLNFSMWKQLTLEQMDPVQTPEPPEGTRLIGTRRNFMGPFTSFDLEAAAQNRVTLTYGEYDLFGAVGFLREVLGPAADARACAVATFFSPPCIIESRAFFPGARG